jgi:hypothetical protein
MDQRALRITEVLVRDVTGRAISEPAVSADDLSQKERAFSRGKLAPSL